jgi:hypothetical protein
MTVMLVNSDPYALPRPCRWMCDWLQARRNLSVYGTGMQMYKAMSRRPSRGSALSPTSNYPAGAFSISRVRERVNRGWGLC